MPRHDQPIPGIAFSGERYFLSNMYPCTFIYEGLEYSSSEHAFQAQKCVHPADANLVRMAVDGFQAKRVARAVQRIRPDWDAVRVGVMRAVVGAKFTQNLPLLEKLLATGDEELVEHNTWKDRFWGVYQGKGENHLGIILMEVRTELRRQECRNAEIMDLAERVMQYRAARGISWGGPPYTLEELEYAHGRTQ